MPHWLATLDRALEPLHIDKAFIENHKYYNIRKWFRDDLADYVREILLDRRTLSRPFINKGFLEEIVNRHISGRWNYSALINLMITIELTFRLLIEDMGKPAIDW